MANEAHAMRLRPLKAGAAVFKAQNQIKQCPHWNMQRSSVNQSNAQLHEIATMATFTKDHMINVPRTGGLWPGASPLGAGASVHARLRCGQCSRGGQDCKTWFPKLTAKGSKEAERQLATQERIRNEKDMKGCWKASREINQRLNGGSGGGARKSIKYSAVPWSLASTAVQRANAFFQNAHCPMHFHAPSMALRSKVNRLMPYLVGCFDHINGKLSN